MATPRIPRSLLLPAAVLLALAARPAAAADRTDHRSLSDTKLEDCRECHRASGVIENHGNDFLRLHRAEAAKSTNNCSDCHATSYCLDCHNGGRLEPGGTAERSLSRRGEAMPPSHAADFLSTHPIKAADDPRSCNRCHAPSFCSDCHNRQMNSSVRGAGRSVMNIKPHAPVYVAPGVPAPGWISAHRQDARRNLQSCAACHPAKSSCSNPALGCHANLGGR